MSLDCTHVTKKLQNTELLETQLWAALQRIFPCVYVSIHLINSFPLPLPPPPTVPLQPRVLRSRTAWQIAAS